MGEHQHVQDRFVEAGLKLLASGHNVPELTQDVVVSYSGLDKNRFQEEFPDPLAYLAAVRNRLQDEVKQDVAIATAPIQPSVTRLMIALDEFLDSSLRHPSLRELDVTLHAYLSKSRKHRSFINGFAKLFEMECKSIGIPHAQAHSRLFVAMCGCARVAEHEARRPLREFRETIRSYLQGLEP
jgi:hypothetical protein